MQDDSLFGYLFVLYVHLSFYQTNSSIFVVSFCFITILRTQSGQLEHDYESSGNGGNRFATILMYMSDLNPETDGGETVFPKVYPPNLKPHERKSESDVLYKLRHSEQTTGILKENSWEEKLTIQCRTRFSITPHSSRAVLFYSQLPNGHVDKNSLHGACPILNGQKYAANLWYDHQYCPPCVVSVGGQDAFLVLHVIFFCCCRFWILYSFHFFFCVLLPLYYYYSLLL